MKFSTRHWRHALWIGLLGLTGFALFLSSWRRAVGPLFAAVEWIHIVGGILYGMAIVGWSRVVFPWRRDGDGKLGPGYARWGYLILIMLVVSGAGLLVGPSPTRAIATVLHGLAALALVVWVIWHLITRLPVSRQPTGEWHLARRRTLRWLASAIVAVPVVMGLPTLLKMLSGRLFNAGSNDGALPGFVPYTVVDGYPHIPRDRWHLWIHGLSEDLVLSWADYATLPRRTVVINFRCVTGWVVPHVEFEGVDLLDFLLERGWNPSDKPWVTFYSGDGVYTDTLTIDQIRQYRPLLADTIDHEPLPVAQGFPVRLLVPRMYGYKSVKWLVGIHVARTAAPGYWEQRGYPQNAFFGSYP
jgi:DMSO/TMAO reductase YedYZ molybdopterin-dependent catalytic subunit